MADGLNQAFLAQCATGLSQAAADVEALVGLWPLEDAVRIDNDVKYGEELQVRITRELAAGLVGAEAEVTIPDAEYVYEGAVAEIPGRPVQVAQALLTANDAYDEAAGFSEDQEAAHILATGQILGCDWSAEQADALASIIQAALTAAEGLDEADTPARLALSATIYAQVLALGEAFAATALLFVNELNEVLGLPRVFVDNQAAQAFHQQAVAGLDGEQTSAQAFAAAYAQAVSAECAIHRDDVLWDPEQAKKAAKEADEAKNKAALAAKFAHVDNDAGKEHVEL